MQISDDKQQILKQVIDWFKKSSKQFITIGGYAGTGKTTLISLIRQSFKEQKDFKVAFASYTGKAAQVLQDNLRKMQANLKGDSVSTIHALIYSPLVNANEEIIGWERKTKITADLIIIDEASMVDAQIWKDLLQYGKKIIAVGDHGQLPPIGGQFNLLDKPDLILTQIHRQAEDNPIIGLSIQAREQGRIETGKYAAGVLKISRQDSETQSTIAELLNNYNQDTLVLCGYNHTRVKLNQYIRSQLEFFSPDPQNGERVICLRNNHKQMIYNGMQGTISTITIADDDWYLAEIIFDNAQFYKGLILRSQFNSRETISYTKERAKTIAGDLFDFGYALTVHKAQGSQAKRVILFEERFAQMDDQNWKKWLYTAVTRAEQELYIIGD